MNGKMKWNETGKGGNDNRETEEHQKKYSDNSDLVHHKYHSLTPGFEIRIACILNQYSNHWTTGVAKHVGTNLTDKEEFVKYIGI